MRGEIQIEQWFWGPVRLIYSPSEFFDGGKVDLGSGSGESLLDAVNDSDHPVYFGSGGFIGWKF